MKWTWLLGLLVVVGCSEKETESNNSEDKKVTKVESVSDIEKPDLKGSEVISRGLEKGFFTGQLSSIREGVVFLEANDRNRLVKVGSAEIDSLGFFRIGIKDLKQNFVYRVNIADKGTAFIYKDSDALNLVEVEEGSFDVIGSDESSYYNSYMAIALKYNGELAALNKSFQHYRYTGQKSEAEKTLKEFNAVNDSRLQELSRFLEAIPASITLMSGTGDFTDKQEDYSELLKSILHKFKTTDKVIPNIEVFVSELESMLSIAIGEIAPDFELPSATGENIKLSSLRGSYVMIDFWASWCGPCRSENPNVVKMYNKYKAKGFEILGVSLDKDEARWKTAISKDGLEWPQVSDLKFWNSKAAKLYGVKGIPFTVLLDKKGVIIAKNLRGKALEIKLESLIGG